MIRFDIKIISNINNTKSVQTFTVLKYVISVAAINCNLSDTGSKFCYYKAEWAWPSCYRIQVVSLSMPGNKLTK